MRFVLQIAMLWAVLGLIAGLLLRARLPWRHLGALYLVSGLPWLIHLLHTSYLALARAEGIGGAVAWFVGSSLLLGALTIYGGWRLLRTPPVRLALVPLALLAVYGLPLALFLRALSGAGVALNTVSVVALVAGTLFAAASLAVYAAGRGVSGLPVHRR
jgi:hypothetical protein